MCFLNEFYKDSEDVCTKGNRNAFAKLKHSDCKLKA